MRRHLEGAQLQQAQSPRRGIRRVELVDTELGTVGIAGHIDQQIAQQTIYQPRLGGFLAGLQLRLDLLERNLQLVKIVVAGLVDSRRLTGRANELTGK